MSKLLLLVILAVGGKFGYDAWMGKQSERAVVQAVAQFNAQLPISTPDIRVEKATYADRQLRVSGALLGARPLTDQAKALSRAKIRESYCGVAALQQAGVSVQYAFTKIALASMSDKVRSDDWELTLSPKDCQ